MVGKLMTHVDKHGRTWDEYTIQYTHDIDDMKFSFNIFAIDYADAIERLQYIRDNAIITGKLIETIGEYRG